MNAVLFYNLTPHQLRISGVVINCLEYFFTIYEQNPEIKLYILNANENIRQELIELSENRYYLDDLKFWQENFIPIKYSKIIREKFNKVLVVDYETVNKTCNLLRADEIIQIQEDDNYKFPHEKVKIFGEMPFHYKDVQYKMKMMFSRYRNIKKSKEGIYVNSPRNRNWDFLKYIDLPDKPIVYKERSHLDNMFEQFDTYLYWHANTWFDPHPRLFHESYYYGKKIMYYNHPKVKDGGWYRYHDMLENGLAGRILTKNDEIVREFI